MSGYNEMKRGYTMARLFMRGALLGASLLLLACAGSSSVTAAPPEAKATAAAPPAPAYDVNDPRYKAKVEDTTTRIEPEKKDIVTLTSAPPKTLEAGGIHDMQNDSTVVLQNPTEALAKFPLDRRNGVDWVLALNDGLVNPRADVAGKATMKTLDLDILMKDTAGMPWVRFPHLAHTKWLDCSNCHPAPFEPVDNGNPVSMTKILRGEYCGICHDKVAFSTLTCERCHNTPH